MFGGQSSPGKEKISEGSGESRKLWSIFKVRRTRSKVSYDQPVSITHSARNVETYSISCSEHQASPLAPILFSHQSFQFCFPHRANHLPTQARNIARGKRRPEHMRLLKLGFIAILLESFRTRKRIKCDPISELSNRCRFPIS